MARALSAIPVGSQIVDKAGAITIFFRFRWQQLIDSFAQSPVVGQIQKPGQTAALGATAIYTTKSAGWYRVSFYMRKTVIDGVSSSLTATMSWTETGVPLTETGAALATDAVSAQQTGEKTVWADGATDITIAIAYASNTPNRMTYRLDASVEQLVSA